MSDQPAPSTAAPAIDRKVWIPQIAMVCTFIIAFIASKRGLDIPAEIQVVITGLVTTLIGGLVGWATPMSRAEITGRMTNDLVAEAQADDASPVDLSKIIDDKIIIQAQLDPGNNGATMPEGETTSSLKDKLIVEEMRPPVRPEEKV